MLTTKREKVTVISVNVKLNTRITHNECIYHCFVKNRNLGKDNGNVESGVSDTS